MLYSYKVLTFLDVSFSKAVFTALKTNDPISGQILFMNIMGECYFLEKKNIPIKHTKYCSEKYLGSFFSLLTQCIYKLSGMVERDHRGKVHVFY